MLRRLVYRFYEGRLEAEVRRGAIPHHVGVLPDGNRRFARTSGLANVGAGHCDGADNIERLIDWCDELGIPVITVWVLSTDNMHRPADELDAIFEIVETRVEALAEQQRRAASEPSAAATCSPPRPSRRSNASNARRRATPPATSSSPSATAAATRSSTRCGA